jgi:HD superfamily phosphohydrolase
MARKMKTPKVVVDPLYGIIDIRPVLTMVEAEEFQLLGDKKQLGLTHLIFPSATHTRKAHSLGSYHATRELADQWIKLGFITRREGDALAGYALYHDIGHPAFSHITEPLCALPSDTPKAARGMSMNAAMSLAIINRRRKEIEACGIDFKLMLALASHKDPLHAAVSDKNFGMEKLDYLERDGLATILSRPVGVDYLRHHIYFAHGALAIDEKVVDNAIEAQNFYLKMYKNVYLRKTSAIAQRMLQKMTHRLILAATISPADLVNLTDSELLGIMRFSEDPVLRPMYALWRKRDLYREAIVIRPKRFAGYELRPGKTVRTIGATDHEMRHLTRAAGLQVRDQQALAALESAIAAAVGIPEPHVLVVPIVNPERFEAKDILVYRGPGKAPSSLKERYPAHFKNLEEVAEDYLTFRIATTEPYRAKLCAPRAAHKVFALLFK